MKTLSKKAEIRIILTKPLISGYCPFVRGGIPQMVGFHK